MLTPFTDQNEVDFQGLERLIHWYEEGGASGLFSVCLSSEMFNLSLGERVAIARFVRDHSRLPVVASGHLNGDFEQQVEDLQAMVGTGVDAVVMISSSLASEDESDSVLLRNLERLMDRLDPSMDLGIYECPVPYKRVLSDEVLAFIVETGRFTFLKDTCCDINRIKRRLHLIKDTPLKLFNAHADTLVESLLHGTDGYSGVQANCSIKLLRTICDHFAEADSMDESLDLLRRVAEFLPAHHYHIAAKEVLRMRGVISSNHTRAVDMTLFEEDDRSAAASMFEELEAYEDRLTAIPD